MAEQLAAKENQADVLAGVDIGEEDSDDVKDILVDLTRRETRNFGVVFAQNLIKEMKVSTKMFKVPHQTGGLQGSRGARRAVGADRTRLPVEQERRKAAAVGRMAGRDRRIGGAGDRQLFQDEARGSGPISAGQPLESH